MKKRLTTKGRRLVTSLVLFSLGLVLPLSRIVGQSGNNDSNVVAAIVGVTAGLRPQGRANVGATRIQVDDFGAKGDGNTDDSAALEAARDASGKSGVTLVFRPSAVYRTTRRFDINKSNVIVEGNNAEILFQPVDVARHERALYIQGSVSDLRNVKGPISIGAISFTASSAVDTADLMTGDWLTIQERDPRMKDLVAFDMVQVRAVNGQVVSVFNPFRVAFTAIHETVKFRRVTNLVENTVIRDLRIRSTDEKNHLVGIAINWSRNTILENVVSQPRRGNAFFSYQAQGVKLVNCAQLSSQSAASEFAATVDLSILGTTFSTVGASSDTSALAIDTGSGFFGVIGNQISNGANVLMQITTGAHDGLIIGNTFGFSQDEARQAGHGLVLRGTERVIVSNNILIGGVGSGTGISTGDSLGFTANIVSRDNQIKNNIVSGYAVSYDISPNDVLQAGNSFFPGLVVEGGLKLKSPKAKPECTAVTRGTFWLVEGASGTRDLLELCTKGADDIYAWRQLY